MNMDNIEKNNETRGEKKEKRFQNKKRKHNKIIKRSWMLFMELEKGM